MQKTHKRHSLILISIFIAAVLIMSCTIICGAQSTAYADVATANAAESHSHDGMTELTALPTGGNLTTGMYYLGENISGNITVSGTVTLCLNGHTIMGDGNGTVITVSESANFNLCDCTDEGVITGGNADSGGGVYVGLSAEFTMTGGSISGNTAKSGGGVYVDGTLSGNNSATFNMSGGSISGNTASGSGGGVYINDGTFEMTGGNISGNTAETSGGGVYARNPNKFIMTAGEISSNTANNGGGVYFYGMPIELSGTAAIINNTANNGGGVLVQASTFNMLNGTISGNTANNNGGGVCVMTLGTFNMSGGTISGNTANNNGGGVYDVNTNNNFTLSGTPNITGNHKTNGNDNNVYLRINKTITVVGALERDGKKAQIGVTLSGGAGEIATGYTGENNPSGKSPSNYFIPDNETYNCVYVSDETSGKVSIGTHNLESGECTDCHATQDLFWGFADGVLTLSSYKDNPATPYDYDTYETSGLYYPIWSSSGDNNANVSSQDIISVTVDGYAYAPQSMQSWFNSYSELVSADLSGLDTSRVTDMRGMFQSCSVLTSVNLSSFDTSRVTDMSAMFYGCNLRLVELDLSNFVTTSVEDMRSMFYLCSALTELNLSNFDTTSLTNADNMFSNCDKLNVIHTPNTVGDVALSLPCNFWDSDADSDADDSVKFTDSITSANANHTLYRHQWGHTGGTATCAQLAECEICGEEYGDFANHDYDLENWAYDETYHWHECSNCGAETENGEHRGEDDGNVFTAVSCDDCGFDFVPAMTVEVKFGGTTTYYPTVSDAFDYANGLTTTQNNFAIITLLADVTTDNTLTVNNGKYITLDLGGKMLKYNDSETDNSVISVRGNFTLDDSEKDLPQDQKTPHKYNVSTDGLWVFDESGTETIYGGVITGGTGQKHDNNDSWRYGGGVFVAYGSTFVMSGGNICGNTASNNGGGVYSYYATTTVTGGKICGNYAVNGGGVYAYSGTLKISGTVEIKGNTVPNTSITQGGGGLFSRNCKLEVSGAPNITGNYKTNGDDNNVYLYYDTITVAGALEQDGNKAQIGVTHSDGAGEIATGFTSENNPNDRKPSDYFISDRSKYGCVYVSDGESGTVTIDNHNYNDAPWMLNAERHWQACQNSCGTWTEMVYHNFNKEVVSDSCLKSAASCIAKAVYYMSCECGAHGTDTFENGELAEHTLQKVSIKTATCLEYGVLAHDHCTVCEKNFIEGVEKTAEELKIAKVAHTPADAVRKNVVDSTCSKEGSYDEVFYCSVCDYEISRTPKTIDKIAHTEEDILAVAATCTTKGSTAGKRCKVCGTVTVAPTEIAMIPHTEVTDSAVAPTCTEEGKTEGKHCSVCDTVLVEPTTVEPVGHTLAHVPAIPATSEEDGNIEYWECDECGKYFADEDGSEEITDKSSVVLPKLPAPENNGDQTPHNGLSAGATAGIVIGLIIFLLLAAYVSCYFLVYRRGVLTGKAMDAIYLPMNAIFGKKENEQESEEDKQEQE